MTELKPRIPKDSVSRILISRLRFLGDVILTTPLIRHFRQHFPRAHIAYLTEARFAPVLQNNPHLDEIIPTHSQRLDGESGWQANWRQVKFLLELRQRRFDLAVDLFGNPRTALQTWMSGAKWRVGGDFRGRGLLYNLRIPAAETALDAIEFHLQSLRRLGLAPGDKKTEIFLTPDEELAAVDYLQRRGLEPARAIVGLHPGATWPNKRWPVEYFRELAQRLLQDGVQVFVTCGPGEEELAQQVVGATTQGAVVGDILSLRQLAAVLRQFSLLVTNDCGVMHMAVAVGTPTTGIFGPGEPEIWFPYPERDGHFALWADLDCRPCHQNECPLGTLECMHRTRPEAVFAKIKEVLARVAA